MTLLPSRFLTVGAASLLLATLAPAAYNPALVSADARWLMHLDFDALRESDLGQELIDVLEKTQTEATGGTIRLNIPRLLATLGSVTAYGTNLTADPAAVDGALVAQGSPDLRRIAEGLLLQGTLAEPNAFREIEDLPFPTYALGDFKAQGEKGAQLLVGFPAEPIILVSKSRAQLLKAREVFLGQAPSLARTPTSPLQSLTTAGKGAYVLAASLVPPDPVFNQNTPPARILQLATSGALALGERGGNAFAHAQLNASSARNAEKLVKILEGLTAMLSLAESDDRQLADFLSSTRVARRDDRVTLDLEYSAERLVEMSRALQTQATARPARREPPFTLGTTVAEWKASEVSPDAEGLAWKTVGNVDLVTGARVTLGRAIDAPREARFERVEIVPAGGGNPLVFQREFMRHVRGTMWQFPFPGTPGTYTVRIATTPAPEQRDARFALSVEVPEAGNRSDAPARQR